MAEIHPNDIGLAIFADVGDVEKLKTSAKNLVDALNEIYQNGTQGGSGGFGQQWYVDGENNIILGENNLVYGSNNFIIGSDNIIIGDNINIIANGKQKYNSLKYSLTGIKSGDTVIFRYFNSINTIIFSTLTVKSVSGNTIYLTDDASPGGAGQYAHQLFPDGIIFVQNSNSSYASSSVAGGCYGMATGKYSLADGYHVISAADNAVTFGKYGINEDACSIALANRIKAITGQNSWQANPPVTLSECANHISSGTHQNATINSNGFMSYTDKQKLDNATAEYTASRIMMRDSNGRAKVQSPSGSYDIANKTYVDTNFVKKSSDTTMSAKLTAQSNTAYTTKQVRNIVLWTSGSTPPSTSYGDIVIKTF